MTETAAMGDFPGQGPVVIHAPLAGDGEAIARLVKGAGPEPLVCHDAAALEKALGDAPPAPVQALILSHEGCGEVVTGIVKRALDREPEWSNPPVVILLEPSLPVPPAFEALASGTNGQLLLAMSRPVSPRAFRSTIEAQFKVRNRQFEAARMLQRLKESEAQKEFLLEELRHRTRNTLAVLHGIFKITARQATDMDSLIGEFSARLDSIARAQSALAGETDASRSLSAIVEAHAHPYCMCDSQLRLDGPEICLTPRAAFDFAMIVHELATNAAKYGALSKAEGVVDVRWYRRPKDGRLEVEWRESGGPPVTAPTRRGLGSALLQATGLVGNTKPSIDYDSEGFRWSAPLAESAVDG